ncbi:YhgE/Pip domain-containing protein [Dellaglioa algida]|uniref:YhgE/Pip domain-containing protein n=1 Tax=Dellaglioa algida TaxID=105612 RepID=UPI0024C47D97|nr:YhgE/Pip domain-containing protein [Dellaglioa algida]MDK1728861.1 YhgE/Pip domain-containing protein [Dellaglioa algida]MDK1736423.1 YhgE/Pip domain-containing protein [Dellaglioa algida]MDK1737157.1 YhgE/Pip domain-containing protein [Dellaglioa algida]
MKMIKNEFKFVGKNRLILISTIVMMLIPILYAAFFLKSVWDPYGKTSELPVAVVNNDKSVKYNGETLDVGDQLVKELKSNHQLKWMFVSEEQAKQGMKDNKYYTTITLPENFSSNAATLLDTNPKKMQITYDTNASRNYIGEVISEAAAKQLNSQIRESVTESYATAIFGQVKTIGKGFKTAATGSKKLSDGTITLNDGLNSYITGVGTVNNGVQTLSTSVVPLKNGVQQLTTGAGSLSAGLSKLDNSTGALASGVSKLDSGSSTLASGVVTYTNGVGTVNTGLQTLNGSTGALASGVTKLDAGSKGLVTGVKGYTNGVSKLNTGLGLMSAKSKDLNAGTQAVSDGVALVQSGDQMLTKSLKEKTKELDEQLDKLHDPNAENIDDLKAGIKGIDSVISMLNSSLNGANAIDMGALTNDLSTIGDNTIDAGSQMISLKDKLYNKGSKDSVATQLTSAQSNMGSLVAFIQSPDFVALKKSNPVMADKISDSVQGLGSNLQTAGSSLQDSGDSATQIGKDLKDNGDKLTEIEPVIKELLPKLTELKKVIPKLVTVPKKSEQTIDQLIAGLTMVQTRLEQRGTTPSTMGAIQATESINDELTKIQAGLKGADGLIPGVQQYTAGASAANAGSKQLTAKNSELVAGAGQLNTGLSTLNGSVPTLTSGVSQLAAGSSQLAANSGALVSGSGQLSTGLSTLDGSVPALTSGIGQLSTGSNTLSNGLVTLNNQVPALVSGVDQLAAGTQKLDDNSAKLGDGSKTLKDGTKTLATALKTGSDTVNGIKATNKTAQMFAAPSELKHKDYSYVPNYGHALAPYVLSLALYVGAIVFNFAFPIRKVSMEGQSATAWFWSKVAIGTVVAIGMAVVEVTGMLMFGLQADHIAQTYLIATTFSLTSMYLVMALAMAFDNPGRFVAMVLLMLQLGGAGGTFPMEVTNSFFNAIHPFLPMTYSTLGFRQSLTSGMVSGQVGMSVLILAIFAIVSLVLLWVAMQVLQNIGLAGKSQLDDNQKLQDLEK